MRITKFKASANNQCPSPNATVAPGVSFTVPPTNPQVTLSWSTVFAGSVDLSVDGPGVYQSNVGASNTMTIPYGCPGPHTYTLTAHGSGGTLTTKTITVSTASTTSVCVTGEPCVP